MLPKVVMLTYGNYIIVKENYPNKQYLVKDGINLGSFNCNRFIAKKHFNWSRYGCDFNTAIIT